MIKVERYFVQLGQDVFKALRIDGIVRGGSLMPMAELTAEEKKSIGTVTVERILDRDIVAPIAVKQAKEPRIKPVTADFVTPTGKPTILTPKQLRAEVVAGNLVYNKQGKKIPCTIMAEKFPDKKLNITVVVNGKIKSYYIN